MNGVRMISFMVLAVTGHPIRNTICVMILSAKGRQEHTRSVDTIVWRWKLKKMICPRWLLCRRELENVRGEKCEHRRVHIRKINCDACNEMCPTPCMEVENEKDVQV